MFLAPLLMVYIFLILFVLEECVLTLVTSITETYLTANDLLNIDNPYFEQMVGQIYPTELKRYHNVFVWLYIGFVTTQRCVNVFITFSIRCGKVVLEPTTGKRC